MLSCRPFARFFPLAWLLVFALVLSAPTAAFAKVDMVNGRDGAEGDPDDSLDGIGGGGGSDSIGDPPSKLIVIVGPIGASLPVLIVPTVDFAFIHGPDHWVASAYKNSRHYAFDRGRK